MAWGNMIPLLVGGVIIVGLGYVAYTAWGTKGPYARFNPNPILKDYPHASPVTLTVGGFKPNEAYTVAFKKLDGTMIIEGTEVQHADANGNIMIAGPPEQHIALMYRGVAEFFQSPGGIEVCFRGAESGTAVGRLIIEPGYPAIPPPVVEGAAASISRLTGGAGSYSGSAMRLNVM